MKKTLGLSISQDLLPIIFLHKYTALLCSLFSIILKCVCHVHKHRLESVGRVAFFAYHFLHMSVDEAACSLNSQPHALIAERRVLTTKLIACHLSYIQTKKAKLLFEPRASCVGIVGIPSH